MHVTTTRVRYAETDQAGVAYHANYLHWFEVGRTEMLRRAGCTYSVMEREQNLLLTVVEARLQYHRPAVYDDLLAIETSVGEVRRVRTRLDTRILRHETGELLCSGYIWLAMVAREGRPTSMPAGLREALETLSPESPGRPVHQPSSE